MLTPKQRAYLKSLANTIKPSVNVGKGEIDDGLIMTTRNAVEANELIKVKVLQNGGEPEGIAERLSLATGSEVVSIIGRVITLYKGKKRNSKIVLR